MIKIIRTDFLLVRHWDYWVVADCLDHPGCDSGYSDGVGYDYPGLVVRHHVVEPTPTVKDGLFIKSTIFTIQ